MIKIMSKEFRYDPIEIKEDFEERNNSTDILGFISFMGGTIAGIYGLCYFGPIDGVRSGYNFLLGDLPALKSELLDYNRTNLKEKYRGLNTIGIEQVLADTLDYKLLGNTIDAQKISLDTLWDASEDTTNSLYERWVWTSLGK